MVPTGGVRTLVVIKPRATPTKGEPRKGAHRKTCTVLMGYSKGSALWPAPSSLCCRVPCVEVGLLAVVARAGPQVGGVVVENVADHVLVEAAVRVGVVVGDLKGGDDPVHVLLDLLGRGFYI